MSDTVTGLIWSRSSSRNGARLVMLALAREADDHCEVAMTLENISKSTLLSKRAVSKCIAELLELGEISRRRGGGATHSNVYSILLGAPHARDTDGGKNFPPSPHSEPAEETEFLENSSLSSSDESGRGNFEHPGQEVSSTPAPGGSTPVGSTTTTKEQASSLEVRRDEHVSEEVSVTVPDRATELVTAITNAGMIVGWRLTNTEWDRVTALAARWGSERLVEMVARRWNADRPPQSARYLLRIWDDLPSLTPETIPAGNVVPLRRLPQGWAPFQNTAVPSAYQNGF